MLHSKIKENEVFKIGYINGFRYYLRINGRIVEISKIDYEKVINVRNK